MADPGTTIVTRRHLPSYDRHYSLRHWPLRFLQEKIDLAEYGEPTVESVRRSFLALVRAEDLIAHESTETSIGSWETSTIDELGLLKEYVATCERELVYGASDSLPGTDRDRHEQIWSIVCDPRQGNARNARFQPPSALEPAISECVVDRAPMRFVLPAFPFKDQNPERCSAPASHPDLGDVALLVRLHTLALSIGQVFPYGAEWTVVSDGVPYSRMFGIEPADAKEYVERLRDYRSLLNLTSVIHFIDLEDAIRRFDHAATTRGALTIAECREQIAGQLWSLVREEEQVSQAHSALTVGIARNCTPERRQLAGEVAIEYASLTVALSHVQFYDSMFPHSVRATVHAKPEQIAIPRLGGAYPWNGVGVMRGRQMSPRSIETWPLSKVASRHGVVAGHAAGRPHPSVYLLPAK